MKRNPHHTKSMHNTFRKKLLNELSKERAFLANSHAFIRNEQTVAARTLARIQQLRRELGE